MSVEIPAFKIPADLEIKRTLVLSTAHVSFETMEHLIDIMHLKADFPVGIYEKGEYGWFCSVPEQTVEKVYLSLVGNAEMRPDLLNVLCFAAAAGCDWVEFDRDGNVVDGLPTWGW